MENNIQKIKLSKKTKLYALYTFALLAALLGILITAIQHDFKYTETEDYYVLTITGADVSEEDLSNVLTEAAKSPNVARIDRKANKVYFQNTGNDQLVTLVSEKVKEPYSANLTKVLASTTTESQLILLAKITLIFVVSMAGVIFYYFFKREKGTKLRYPLYLFTIILMVLALTLATTLGFLVAFSNLYMLKTVDFLALATLPVYLIVATVLISSASFAQKNLSLRSVSVSAGVVTKNNMLTIIKLSSIFLLVPVLGFGTNYVVFSVLNLFALIFCTLNLYSIPLIFYALADRSSKKVSMGTQDGEIKPTEAKTSKRKVNIKRKTKKTTTL